MALLGDTLNLEMEVEAVEHWVGPFRADILARAADSESDHRIVIENQFGKTNHGHLGQLLTYLAGIEGAKTVVWDCRDDPGRPSCCNRLVEQQYHR